MNHPGTRPRGYAFALPRLLARLAGRKARRAEFSRVEAYGLGIVVFGLSLVGAGRVILPFVRPWFLRAIVLLLLPFVVWMAWLLLYYLNALLAAGLRRRGLYSAVTNNPLQHFIIMSLITALAVLFWREEAGWLRSLGAGWLLLLGANLLAIFFLKLLHDD